MSARKPDPDVLLSFELPRWLGALLRRMGVRGNINIDLLVLALIVCVLALALAWWLAPQAFLPERAPVEWEGVA